MSGAVLTVDTLKKLIIESLNLEGVTPDMIGEDDPLFGDGLGLDSVDALELVIALEKKLGVKIRTHEIDPEVFASVNSMLQFVESRTAGEQDISG
jgi:acyl carrier protein